MSEVWLHLPHLCDWATSIDDWSGSWWTVYGYWDRTRLSFKLQEELAAVRELTGLDEKLCYQELQDRGPSKWLLVLWIHFVSWLWTLWSVKDYASIWIGDRRKSSQLCSLPASGGAPDAEKESSVWCRWLKSLQLFKDTQKTELVLSDSLTDPTTGGVLCVIAMEGGILSLQRAGPLWDLQVDRWSRSTVRGQLPDNFKKANFAGAWLWMWLSSVVKCTFCNNHPDLLFMEK